MKLPLLLTSLLICIQSLSAQPTEYAIRSDSLIMFGRTIAVHNGYAIVNQDSLSSTDVLVLKKEGNSWIELAELEGDVDATSSAPSNSAFSSFMDGDRAIWGAPDYSYPTRANGGIAFVYRRDGDSWSREGTLSPADVNNSGDFGLSVALDDDLAIVGAPDFEEDASMVDEGAAYIFRYDGSQWVQEARLLPDDREGGKKFGRSVDISGDYAIVGVLVDNEVAAAAGAAYIFERENEEWTQVAKLFASDANTVGAFGTSVAIEEELALIGAQSEAGNAVLTGAAYVFEHTDDDTWVETTKITASDGASGDFFGNAVSLDDDCAAIGAFAANQNQGAVYVYVLEDDAWQEQIKLMETDENVTSNQFGLDVSLSGNTLAVGAPFSDTDDNLALSGSITFFEGVCTLTDTSNEWQPGDDQLKTQLHQNYPNPFRHTTSISFSLADTDKVTLTIYNILGQQVSEVINRTMTRGTHTVSLDQINLPNGVYVYHLEHQGTTYVRKMTVVE